MKALGVIFSDIHEKEIQSLTAKRTMASVPFGGRYRLIDFILSNMSNGGISKIGVVTKANYQSLMQHLGSGKFWDLSRKTGGLMILPPFGDDSESGLYSSRMEALISCVQFLRNSDEELVVLSDSDNVCNIDFSLVLEHHERNLADITVIYRKKELFASENKVRTTFEIDNDNRVTRVIEGKKLSGEHNCYTNMLVIKKELLLKIIEERRVSLIGDVLTKTGEYRIFAHEHAGYFASIDSLKNYYKHSMQLFDRKLCEQLFYEGGGHIYTKVRDSAPCTFGEEAFVQNSIIADGCIIEGEVINSILFRGVKVKRGAKVIGSVLFQNTTVGAGSTLNCVISDKDANILEKRLLSGHETQPYFISKGSTI